MDDPRVARDRPFTSVLYLNDIVACASDLLELLLQRQRLGADLVCAPDYAVWLTAPPLRIRDVWVARDIRGAVLWDEDRFWDPGAVRRRAGGA